MAAEADETVSRDRAGAAYAYFRVTSSTLTRDDVSEILGREPDRGWSVGEPFRRANSTRALVRTFTSWKLESGVERSADLESHLNALRPRVEAIARNVRDVRADMECVLQIVQSGEGEAFDGIHLDGGWVTLLASMSASVDVDQAPGGPRMS